MTSCGWYLESISLRDGLHEKGGGVMKLNIHEGQFQLMLAHYMYSWWTSVEVKNGIQLGNDILFPAAKAYSPYEDRINDSWLGYGERENHEQAGWGRDIDFLLMDRDCHIYVMEIKRKVSRLGFLELLGQAFCSAYWLSTRPSSRLPEMFHHSLLVLYGVVNRRPEDLPEKLPKSLKDPRNGLLEIHRRFYKKEQPCSLGDISLIDSIVALALNPGERFTDEMAHLTHLSVGEIISLLPDSSRQLERLQEIPASYQRPVRLLEFDLDFSMCEHPTAG